MKRNGLPNGEEISIQSGNGVSAISSNEEA